MSNSDSKVLKFPTKETTATTDNPFMSKPPADAAGTDAYMMTTVNYSHTPLKTVPDIKNASTRNKKWGAVFSVGILSELDKHPTGPAAVPNMPSQFFDADDLRALRARLVFEIDKAIQLTELQMNDPAKFEQYEEEFYKLVSGARAPRS